MLFKCIEYKDLYNAIDGKRKKSLLKCERRLLKLPKGAIIIYPFLLSSHFHNHIHTHTCCSLSFDNVHWPFFLKQEIFLEEILQIEVTYNALLLSLLKLLVSASLFSFHIHHTYPRLNSTLWWHASSSL